MIATGMPAEEIAGLKALFEAIDRDRSGTITAEELREALKMKGAVLRAADLETLMSLIDVDASGTIEYEEVSDWVGLHFVVVGEGWRSEGGTITGEWVSGWGQGGGWSATGSVPSPGKQLGASVRILTPWFPLPTPPVLGGHHEPAPAGKGRKHAARLPPL